MMQNNTQKVSLIIIFTFNFRGRLIQDTKQLYANIIVLLKVVVMEINANLHMEIRNYVLIIIKDFPKWEHQMPEIKYKIVY